MKKPNLKKEYTREDLVIFGNYLLSKERKQKIVDGQHYKMDKDALSMVHHADIENALSQDRYASGNFNAGVLIDKPKRNKRSYYLTKLSEAQNLMSKNHFEMRDTDVNDSNARFLLTAQRASLQERINDLKELLRQTKHF